MRKKKAFTLIELMIVIVIIGILATFVVIILNGARNRARNSNARASVTSIGTILESEIASGTTLANTAATGVKASLHPNVKTELKSKANGADGKTEAYVESSDDNTYTIEANSVTSGKCWQATETQSTPKEVTPCTLPDAAP